MSTRRTAQEIAQDYAQRSEAALRRAMFASHPHRSEARRAMNLLRSAAQDETDKLVREGFEHAAAKIEHTLSLCGKPTLVPVPDDTPSMFDSEE